MSNLHFLPIFIAILIGAFYLVTTEISQKKMIDKPFLNDLSNELYVLSYSAPFKWFINPNEDDRRVRDTKKAIVESGESHRLNYRVLVTIQILTLILSIIAFGILSIVIDNSSIIVKYLFNISVDNSNPQALLKSKMILAMFLSSLIIIPSIYIKQKAKRKQFFFLKDLPILQLFIILMLKAKRPLSEVIYVLSTANTIYKPIFATTYRIYVRDRAEGLDYLKEAFENTKFEDTIKVLSEYGEYSKIQSMVVLENGLKDITEYTNTLKRRKDIGLNVVAQLSLAIPFLSVILLALAPIAYYGINLLNV